jgi:hypothetical protein
VLAFAAVDAAPAHALDLAYPPITGTVGQPIAPVLPTATPGLIGFTVTPPLPAGLTLDPLTGAIGGTAATAQPATNYVVSATDLLLTLVQTTLSIRIDALPVPVPVPVPVPQPPALPLPLPPGGSNLGAGGLDLGASTPPAMGLPPPLAGKTANAEPLSKGVLIRLPGALRFTRFLHSAQVPTGTEFDARKGAVRLTVTGPAGDQQQATFYGGVFRFTEAAGVATMALVRGSFRVCARPAKAAASKAITIRRLWASGKGAFRTRGRYGSATIRGTKWLTADRCDGTLFRLVQGRLTIRDFPKQRTVILRRGRYLARAA